MFETAAIPGAPPVESLCSQAHKLWDGLADIDATRIETALDYLMRGLCAIVEAQNAEWVGVARLAGAESDPAGGWRPLSVRFLHPTKKLLAAVKAQTTRMDQRFTNEAAIRILAQAGSFRASRLCDVAPEGWFDSDTYRAYYRDCDRTDVIYVAFPVNADTESWFGVFRACGQPPFTERERDAVAYALRGIKWFHRQLLLSHGLLIAGTALTEIERHVLHGLLGGQAEKRIAAALGQSHHTTHGHVTALYRKFGVNNRPALMALWLGQAKPNEPVPM